LFAAGKSSCWFYRTLDLQPQLDQGYALTGEQAFEAGNFLHLPAQRWQVDLAPAIADLWLVIPGAQVETEPGWFGQADPVAPQVRHLLLDALGQGKGSGIQVAVVQRIVEAINSLGLAGLVITADQHQHRSLLRFAQGILGFEQSLGEF